VDPDSDGSETFYLGWKSLSGSGSNSNSELFVIKISSDYVILCSKIVTVVFDSKVFP
jgi:hypothetical protein